MIILCWFPIFQKVEANETKNSNKNTHFLHFYSFFWSFFQWIWNQLEILYFYTFLDSKKRPKRLICRKIILWMCLRIQFCTYHLSAPIYDIGFLLCYVFSIFFVHTSAQNILEISLPLIWEESANVHLYEDLYSLILHNYHYLFCTFISLLCQLICV
jgi:hypothetical protein